jgi:hypothetical protein
MNLEDMLSAINQLQNDKILFPLYLHEAPRVVKQDGGCQRLERGMNGDLVFDGVSVSSWGHEKFWRLVVW